ncbi:MAG: hypothetical protein WKF73_10545 [Nocardioidaceae bacterium]
MSPPARIAVVATKPDLEIPVDLSPVAEQSVVLQPGQEGWLLPGAPGTCGADQIASQVEVSTSEGATTTLEGAWVPLECGNVIATQLLAQPVEPNTQQVRVTAAMSEFSRARAGAP